MADQAGPDAAWFGQLSGGDRAQSGQDGQPAGPQHRAYCQRRASAREPRARAARQGTGLRVRVRHAAAEAAGGNGFDRGADCDPLRGKLRTSALRSEADIARSVAKVGCDATDPNRTLVFSKASALNLTADLASGSGGCTSNIRLNDTRIG